MNALTAPAPPRAEPAPAPAAAPGAPAAPPARRDAAPAGADGALRRDVVRSVGNGAKIGLSLLGTWVIGLAVKLYMPRHLGPETFGGYQFAESFTTTLFIVTGLGVDSYIQKEIPTRREHASDFFGGTLVLRAAMSAVAMAVGAALLARGGKSAEIMFLFVALGAAQVLGYLSYTCATMLQAVGEVDGQSVLNVAGKLVWGAGIAAALALGAGVRGVALAALAAEACKVVGFAALARRHVGLRLRLDVPATAAVVRASLPFLLSSVAQAVYCRVDVSIMSFLTSDAEVGWYGAAATLAGMSLLLAPIVGSVLGPLASRAAARDGDGAELMLVNRRALEAILSVSLPASLLLYLGAEPIVELMFGPEFAPAARSLRLLAPTFVLTYLAMVSGTILVRLERAWAMTWVTVAGMVLSPALNLVLVPAGLRLLGRGGAGVGAGAALVLTETFTAGVFLWLVGRRGVDRRLAVALGKMIAVCAAVVAADALLAPLGVWRLAVDALLYAAGVLATGAVHAGDALGLARGLAASRRRAPAVAGAAS